MSLFLNAIATCPACDTKTKVQLSASVNADRRPDLRAAILDGSFQAQDCPNCGTRMRLPAHLSYLDVKRGQWILLEDATRLPDWQSVEAETHDVFDDSFGPTAPDAARDIGRDLTPRLVFGWPALREKILCRDLDLDDATLEMLKVAIMRDVGDPPLAEQTELRLTGTDESGLGFAWIMTATEAHLSRLAVPTDAYAGIDANAAGWAALRAKFDGVMYLDVKRLLAD